MRRIAMVLAAVLAMIAGESAAGERWRALNAAEIAEVLTGRTLVYDNGARQRFNASGRTLYHAGADSWGYWSLRGDQYCSQWPPNATWTCYDVLRMEGRFRFVDGFGGITEGRKATLATE